MKTGEKEQRCPPGWGHWAAEGGVTSEFTEH